ncbi:MAG: 30S ribosomal protein S17, partial [Bacillota bacterium]
VKTGKVVSNKMEKTVTVSVESVIQHSLYKKTVRRSKKYKAHDENNQCNIGDLVKIMETRPLSKDKRWRVVEVLERAKTLQ